MKKCIIFLSIMAASTALAADNAAPPPERIWTMMPGRADVGSAWLLNTSTGQMYYCSAGPVCDLAPLRDKR